MANKDGFKARMLEEIKALRARADKLENEVRRGGQRETDKEEGEEGEEDKSGKKPPKGEESSEEGEDNGWF